MKMQIKIKMGDLG